MPAHPEAIARAITQEVGRGKTARRQGVCEEGWWQNCREEIKWGGGGGVGERKDEKYFIGKTHGGDVFYHRPDILLRDLPGEDGDIYGVGYLCG